jgi:hypothetical protein
MFVSFLIVGGLAKTEKGTDRFFPQTGSVSNSLPHCFWVFCSGGAVSRAPPRKHKKFLIEILSCRSSLIRAWTFMRSTPKAGQEDKPHVL